MTSWSYSATCGQQGWKFPLVFASVSTMWLPWFARGGKKSHGVWWQGGLWCVCRRNFTVLLLLLGKFPFWWTQRLLSATGIPRVDVPVIRHQALFSCRKVDQWKKCFSLVLSGFLHEFGYYSWILGIISWILGNILQNTHICHLAHCWVIPKSEKVLKSESLQGQNIATSNR